MEFNKNGTLYIPGSLFIRHNDAFNDLELNGRTIFHQTLLLNSEQIKIIKKFIKSNKSFDIRVGMDSKGIGAYFIQFIAEPAEVLGEEEELSDQWQFPTIPIESDYGKDDADRLEVVIEST